MSYGTPAEFTAYLGAMGHPATVTPEEAATLLARATSYIDAVYGPKFCGTPTGGYEQIEAWPRSGAVVFGQAIPPEVVPAAIKRATYRAAYLLWDGFSLVVSSTTGARVKRQKVDGAAEREFFDDGSVKLGNASYLIDAEIDGLLRPFLCGLDDELGGGFIFSIGS